jgi:hypothetical protein
VAEQPPEDDEDQDGAEAAASELLGTITGGNAAQQLTHSSIRVIGFTRLFAGIIPETMPYYSIAIDVNERSASFGGITPTRRSDHQKAIPDSNDGLQT